jgi:hypothetical protein
MNHQQASRLLYLGLFPQSKRFGISPCLTQVANYRIISLASSIRLLAKKIPFNEIKLSLPLTLFQPTENCGWPALNEYLNGSHVADLI